MSKHTIIDFVDDLAQAIELYNDAIGQEAIERAGNNANLKGVVHELLFRDQLNVDVTNRRAGFTAKLTKSPTAHAVDVVQLDRSGRNVGRYQLKDTPSMAGARQTLRKVRGHKYRSTQLMGTEETTRAYNAIKDAKDKTMRSTGISSRRTGRIADNAGVNSRDANLLRSNMLDVADCSANSALLGAALGALDTLVEELPRCSRGEINKTELAGNVAINTGKSAASAAATTAAALAVKEGGKQLAKQFGTTAARRLAGSNVATATAFGLVEMGKDAFDLATGKINGAEFGERATGTVGSTAGGLGGAAAGAAIGTAICPGVGTAIGTIIGGIVGGTGGNSVGSRLGKWLFGD